MSDWADQPESKAWINEVLEEMVPKMDSSAFVISLVPADRTGDVKFWVELGASIMMGKPILIVAVGDQQLSDKLLKIADEVVYVPDGDVMGASPAVKQAVRRMMKKFGPS
jgi:hypothetical protein